MKGDSMKTILSAALAVTLVLSALGAGAQEKAADRKVELAIEQQSLADALNEWAKQTGLQLVSSSSEMMNTTLAPTIKGEYTPKGALEELLKGTSLTYEWVSERAVAIREKPLAVPAALQSTQHEMKQPSLSVARFSGESGSGQPFDVSEQRAAAGAEPARTQRGSRDVEDLEEVVVTGSHIRSAQSISTPITLSGEELRLQGYTRLDQALEQLPQNFKGGVSAASNPSTGIGEGATDNYTYASGVNLRGLGPNSTLILVNGLRPAPTALGGTTDISGIPLSAIDRVEILADGASATYGSDAVAGVVNIITKKDFNGMETGVRLSSVSSGKAPNYGGYLLAGTSWATGNAMLNYDYEQDRRLPASKRTFSASALDPTDLLIEQHSSSVYAVLRQALRDNLRLSADAQYSERPYETDILTGFSLQMSEGTAEHLSGNVQLDYSFANDWNTAVIGQYAHERDNYDVMLQAIDTLQSADYDYRVNSLELRTDGPLLGLPGGELALALGGSARKESFDSSSTVLVGDVDVGGSSRSRERYVKSAYAELLVPLVGEQNRRAGIESLRLDLALRHDDYDDFGSSTNPKVAVRWFVAPGFSVHGSYARSFRAPSLYLLDPDAINTAYVFDFPDPQSASPDGLTRGLLVDGTNADLQPEKSTSSTVGITWQAADSLSRLELAYFNIDYKNRIRRLLLEGDLFFGFLAHESELGSLLTRNPSVAEVEAELAVPGRSIIDGVGGFTSDQILAIAQLGYQNTAASHVRGLDFSANHSIDGRLGRLQVGGSASYFLAFDNEITDASPSVSAMAIVYNPPRVRAKANVNWMRGDWSSSLRANFTGGSLNPNDAQCSGGCDVSSWITFDASLSFARDGGRNGVLDGFSTVVSVFNLFDRNPPYAFSFSGINFDPVNADPLGRTFAISFVKRW
jgi:iron complex outermembrane recepter protein